MVAKLSVEGLGMTPVVFRSLFLVGRQTDRISVLMQRQLADVRPVTIEEIRAARDRIGSMIVRTPLIRWNLGGDAPEIYLKLENLQPINAFKLRGAANAIALLPEEERRRGVWTISAGNAGQGVAFAARQFGVPCTVVVIDKAA